MILNPYIKTGPGRGSFITGCSVHNQRIEERPFQWVYFILLYCMEDDGILDMDDCTKLCVFPMHKLL